ncbi:MAG: response regulator transcription factor [Crocinitomicaceae bacterium]|nr:response regulator transcription factor [Crocinitomicaceae bacterium]
MSSILIIDDEVDILNILKYNLEKEGFNVETAMNGLLGIEKAKVMHPDLIILDVMMPKMDGIQVCEYLRALPGFENTLICFLTARGEDFSQIAGLDAGADDYIAKPVKPRLLVSRINALLRRKSSLDSSSNEDQISDLIIDRDKYMVFKEGEPIHLPKKEFELLSLLASKPDYVFERDVILDSVWGSEIIVGDRTIDVHVRKLREKIGSDYIKTIKGVGYKFVSEELKN